MGDDTVTVVDAAGDVGVLGQVRRDDVLFFEGHGAVLGDGAARLKRMLGQGYGRRRFHLMLPEATLEGCRIITPSMLFLYDSVQELDDDDAQATRPEWMLDEDTAC